MVALRILFLGLICPAVIFAEQNCLSGCYMPSIDLLQNHDHDEYCNQLRQTQVCLWHNYEYCSDHDEKARLRPRLVEFHERNIALCDPNRSGTTGQECLDENIHNAKHIMSHCREIVSRYVAEHPRSTAEESVCLTLDARMNCMAEHIDKKCGDKAAKLYKLAFKKSMKEHHRRACKEFGFFEHDV